MWEWGLEEYSDEPEPLELLRVWSEQVKDYSLFMGNECGHMTSKYSTITPLHQTGNRSCLAKHCSTQALGTM